MASVQESLEAGREHHKAGRLDAAEAIYRRILDQSPGEPEAMHLTGLLAFHRGRLDEAMDWLGRAVAAAPENGSYHGNLGTVRVAAGRPGEAVGALERALELEPAAAEFHNSLGEARHATGNHVAAVTAFRRAIEIEPGFGPAHANMALALIEAGRPEDALASAEAGTAAAPEDAVCRNTLGILLLTQGRTEAAMAAFRRAIELDPGLTAARHNLARLLIDARQYDEAGVQYQAAMEARPREASGYAGMAQVLRMQGRAADSIALQRKAVELEPGNPVHHSNLLFGLLGIAAVDAGMLYEEHRAWNARHAAPLAAPPPVVGRAPERRLRIGYVSPDFRSHPVGRLALPVVAGHDPDGFEVFCYSDGKNVDAVTDRFRAAAQHWRDVHRLDDRALADLVRADNIDILIDLAGHTAGNRLLAFARKPAPVQMAWLGYMSTTGLDAMDYLIGDPVHTPTDCEAEFCETILRMDHDLVCFTAPDDAPEIGALPMGLAGHATFGSFNNPAKITDQAVALWARILHAIPASRLVLKYRGLVDAGTADGMRGRFASHRIAPARLDLLGGSTYREVLETYHRIDLALDTFPYSGTMTTLEALIMGVPVLCCQGERMVSRTSAAHMAAAGLADLVAATPDGLVDLAVSLAGKPAKLAALRAGMRARLASSPLCDVAGFVAELEALYRNAWRRWCESG